MTYTPEQIEAGTYAWTVLRPRADAARVALDRLPWWRFVARQRALRRYRRVLSDWSDLLWQHGLTAWPPKV